MMEVGKGLKRFEVRGFMGLVAKGVEERTRNEHGKRKEREIAKKDRRRLESLQEAKIKREEQKEMWTTPGLRPLAEPPILDWEAFARRHIPSDLRYKALFPDDPEKRCRMKDIHEERAVLLEYMVSIGMLSRMLEGPDQDLDDPGRPSARQKFYMNIWTQVNDDFEAVRLEYKEIWREASGLSRFEFNFLDNDGRTTKLERWVPKGAFILQDQNEEVRRKYGHLISANFVEQELVTRHFKSLGDPAVTGDMFLGDEP